MLRTVYRSCYSTYAGDLAFRKEKQVGSNIRGNAKRSARVVAAKRGYLPWAVYLYPLRVIRLETVSCSRWQNSRQALFVANDLVLVQSLIV